MSCMLFLLIMLFEEYSPKIPHDAPVMSQPVITIFLLPVAKMPAVLYSSVFVVTLVGSNPGYWALMFKSLTTTPVLFTTYNTARYAIAYPLSSVPFLIFSGTLLKSMLFNPIKVALLPNILMFLSV